MAISDVCMNIIRDQQYGLSEVQEFEIKCEIEEALRDNRFVFVLYDKKPVGFLTWHVKPEGIFFNNACILREFRHKNSFIGLRKHFRGKRLFWKNRRRQREVSWNY